MGLPRRGSQERQLVVVNLLEGKEGVIEKWFILFIFIYFEWVWKLKF